MIWNNLKVFHIFMSYNSTPMNGLAKLIDFEGILKSRKRVGRERPLKIRIVHQSQNDDGWIDVELCFVHEWTFFNDIKETVNWFS